MKSIPLQRAPALTGADAVRLALYQPDIPQNVAAILRLAACLGTPVDLIEPCGFVLDDARLRRVAMDYAARAEMRRHASWDVFREEAGNAGDRLVLLTTGAELRYTRFAFRPGDRLMLGRESAGVPAEVHDCVDARVRVPMTPGVRSLNIVTAAAMVLGEALRQTGGFPEE